MKPAPVAGVPGEAGGRFCLSAFRTEPKALLEQDQRPGHRVEPQPLPDPLNPGVSPGDSPGDLRVVHPGCVQNRHIRHDPFAPDFVGIREETFLGRDLMNALPADAELVSDRLERPAEIELLHDPAQPIHQSTGPDVRSDSV
ncbi:MAG: hypothetical protein A2W26_07410 [Acidobacteria bacterium RBG_16_64_8]|nr:MAG: hypothetical protein A2W26_07410 [Acidobacteria bacterium RBG_16_64_8]